MDNIKRELSKKIKNAAKKQKLILLEVIFKLNVNGVIKEIVDDGNVPYYCFERLDTQQKGFSEGELNINDESHCNQKDEDVHEEVMLAKKLLIKGILGDISQQWKCRVQIAGSGFKLRKDYDNLLWQERMLTRYFKLYNEKDTSTVQTTCDKFSRRNKTLKFSMFLMFRLTGY